MQGEWLLALEIPLVVLVIPAAIALGRRAPGGPATVLGAGALLAFLLMWLLETIGAYANNVAPSLVFLYLFLAGALLLLGGWAVALAGAAGERRWGWVALLAAVVYLAWAAFIGVLSGPYSACMFGFPAPYCSTAYPGQLALLLVAAFAGPAVVLAYALLTPHPQRSASLPAGLHVTPLAAPRSEPTTAPEPPALDASESGAGD